MSDSSNASPILVDERIAVPVWDWPVRVVHWAMVSTRPARGGI